MMEPPNYTVGAGRVYLAHDPDDPAFGERYVGSSPGFALTLETDTLPFMESDGGVIRQTGSELLRVDARCSLALDEITRDNLSLYMLAAREPTQVSSDAYSKTIKLVRGNAYDMGATALREITATYEGAPFSVDAAFVVDGAAGILFVRYDADVYTGQEVTVSFVGDGVTNPALSRGVKPYVGPLRYVEDNIAGDNRVLFIPSVMLIPDSDLDLKANSWRNIILRAEVTSIPRWIDKKPVDDYHIAGPETEDFGDLSQDDPAFNDDYGIHTNG